MRIAVISDTHDNLPNTIKALAYIKTADIAAILHCGDICFPETLECLAAEFRGPQYVVFGNGDHDKDGLFAVARQYPHLTLVGEEGEVVLGGRRFAMTHYPGRAEELALASSPDAVFHGHTHIPWEKKVRNTLVLNPGTLAGLYQKATFAILDTSTLARELKILERI